MTVSPKITPGIYSPVTTYFKNDFSLDIATQVEHAKFLYQNGIKGLLLAGSLGEADNLSTEDRFQLVSGVRKGIPDKQFQLICGAPPSGSIERTVMESKNAKNAGADFFMVLIPGFFGPLVSQRGLIDYFSAVADQSPLPIIIYNYPGVSNNVTLHADTYTVLAQHDNIVGAKLTHFNMDQVAMVAKNPKISNNFTVLTGLGQVLVPALSVGVSGAIDGLSAMFPRVMVKLFDLFHQGKTEEAAQLQYLVARADLMIAELNVVGVKHTLKKLYGWGENTTGRPPLSQPVDLGKYEKYVKDIEAVREVEVSLRQK